MSLQQPDPQLTSLLEQISKACDATRELSNALHGAYTYQPYSPTYVYYPYQAYAPVYYPSFDRPRGPLFPSLPYNYGSGPNSSKSSPDRARGGRVPVSYRAVYTGGQAPLMVPVYADEVADDVAETPEQANDGSGSAAGSPEPAATSPQPAPSRAGSESPSSDDCSQTDEPSRPSESWTDTLSFGELAQKEKELNDEMRQLEEDVNRGPHPHLEQLQHSMEVAAGDEDWEDDYEWTKGTIELMEAQLEQKKVDMRERQTVLEGLLADIHNKVRTGPQRTGGVEGLNAGAVAFFPSTPAT